MGIFYLALFVITVLLIRYGLSKLFVKAGVEGWKAYVPLVSDIEWVRLIGKPKYWAYLCFVPMVRTLLKVQMRIDLVKAYGKYGFWEQVAAVFIPFIYFPYIGHQEGHIPEKTKRGVPSLPVGTVYMGPYEQQAHAPERGTIRDWADAILYAGSAAMILRTLYFEAFMIPTTSMERTLMAGDFLFVSKFHYGTRMPMYPVAFPFVHNQLPVVGGKSYLSAFKLPYYRLPGLKKVERNDIVVFNYPAHDIDDSGIIPYGTIEEVSMKENYIKRCVGMPGDVLEVKDHELHINGKPADHPEHLQFKYLARSKEGFNLDKMEDMGFRVLRKQDQANAQNCDFAILGRDSSNQVVAEVSAPSYLYNKLKTMPNVSQLGLEAPYTPEYKLPGIYPSNYTSPMNGRKKYSDDNLGYHGVVLQHNNPDFFGPLKIPKKGEAIALTPENYKLYVRCMVAYEGRKFEAKDGKFYLDGKETTTYIPEKDYYFMMGDNRHNSEDSRFWGFVPEDHIVGTPFFIFFSAESVFNPKTWRLGRIGRGKIK